MNTPASRSGNIVRYIVYFLVYMFAYLVARLVTLGGQLHLWGVILFVLVAAMAGLFFIYRYNREERFFEKSTPTNFWMTNYRTIVLLTVGLVLFRIIIAYLQAKRILPYYSNQTRYLAHATRGLFWFEIMARGVVLAGLQQFLTSGFFFNYLFRAQDRLTGTLGVIASALWFAILNFQGNVGLLFVEFIIGLLLAWSYLATQQITVPVYLAILNGIVAVVMF